MMDNLKKLLKEPLHLAFGNKSGIKNENSYNKELAEELHKPIIREFSKRKVN